MENNDKIINMEALNKKEEVWKRKFKLIKEIAVDSATSQLQDVRTYQWAAGIGLYQGLKYRGNFGQGVKAGLASVVVFTGSNIVVNLVNKWDEIKDA